MRIAQVTFMNGLNTRNARCLAWVDPLRNARGNCSPWNLSSNDAVAHRYFLGNTLYLQERSTISHRRVPLALERFTLSLSRC
jgi:hypothetical protein